jgi:hypothetical protein
MNALAHFVSSETAFEPELSDRGLSGKADLEVVAGQMRERVGRTLHAKRYESFVETLNPNGQTSVQPPDAETRQVNSRINGAIVAAFPVVPRPTALSLEPLQEWEGYVSEIGEETFTARLLDITLDGKYEEEIADFPISDLSDADRELLKPGAVFRWVIGYQRSIGGTKRRVSQLTFRRLPAWTKKDLSDAARKAGHLSQSIEWI